MPTQLMAAAGADSVAEESADDEEEYSIDMGYAEDEEDLALQKDIGPVKYFGVTRIEGVSVVLEPGGEETDVLVPGDIVAAQVPDVGTHARLLDGRGWLEISEDVEEVHPWAARVLKKPGVTKNDAAALAYLSVDEDKLSPLAQHLPLPQRVVDELQRRGIKKASPIQDVVFQRVHRGESMCLQSQTGGGKTLAMLLPLLTAMSEDSMWGRDGDKIVIVTAYRELVIQLFSDIENMGFFPPGQGYATTLIVGNVPDKDALMNANIIIGTANELGGVLHKDRDLIELFNTKLRAVVLDEVDEYTTAPKLFSSRWNIKRKRRLYNEQKMGLQLWDGTGKIEWFMKRTLAYSRRKDFQVLAASATLSRTMARKVYRLLRWDPLGRWYNKPPPLLRPVAAQNVDWQAIPRVPTIPLHLEHLFVPVINWKTDTEIGYMHETRKPFEKGGLPRLKVRAAGGQRRMLGSGRGQRPVKEGLAASLLDGLHDTLKGRGPGSCMVIVSHTMGLTVRDVVDHLRGWGFHETQALFNALWDDPKDWPSKWAIKYTYDERDHSLELAAKHRNLNDRLKRGEYEPIPVGHPTWRTMEERKKLGETTAPILVGFEGNGRGLHFDGIDTVYILGLPQKHEIYLHAAGRVGRLGQKEGGKVISIVPKRGAKVLHAWRKKIGPDVEFHELPIERIRSKPMPVERPFGQGIRRERQLQLPSPVPEEDAEEGEEVDEDADEEGVRLLPPGEEYVRIPSLPGYEPKDREYVRIREMASRTRSQTDDVAARRIAARLARVTNPL